MDIDNFDKNNLICYDEDNGFEGYSKKSSFALISKQNGCITKKIEIPIKETKLLSKILINADQSAVMVKPDLYRNIIPFNGDKLLLELSSDTIYIFSADCGLRPFMVRTPSVHSITPEIMLILRLLSKRYYFMEAIKNEYDFRKQKGFPKTYFMYDTQEKAISGYTVYNGDFSTKKELYMSALTPVNHKNELCQSIAGIGVGIDYMIRNDFLDVEDDICEDFDFRMYRAIMHDPWQNFSKYNGLTGYGCYWMTRLCYQAPSARARACLLHIVKLIEENLPDIPEEDQTDVYCLLYDLQKIAGFELCSGLIEQCRREWDIRSSVVEQSFSRLGDSITGNIIRSYQRSLYFNDTLQGEMGIALPQIPVLDMENSPANTGLLNGYAGEGLLRLTALDQTNNQWMLLF